jgi:DNA helicase-2/ATP-dependent DNA helicase PcrA
MMRIWSLYQKAIFEFVHNGTGNAIVEAAPGSGKTTTLVEALNYIPRALHKSTLFLAFNNKIIKVLKGKISKDVECGTFHSFCLKIIKQFNPRIKVDGKGEKLRKIVSSLVGAAEDDSLRETLSQTISLAKAYLANDREAIESMMAEHEIESPRIDFVELVLRALDISAVQRQVVDFDDMIWFISKFNLDMPTYAFVMVDEAQDCNPARIDVLRRLLSPDTRMVAVGDENQTIFQYCGACNDSMEQLAVMMNAVRFPLTVSYRCARSIVAEAQKYTSRIEADPNSPEGTVEIVSTERMLEDAGPGDFIISRVNAPLVKLCLALLMKGKPCNIQGRDMANSFLYMIKLSKATDVVGFQAYITKWANEQYERIAKRNGDATHIQDRVACIDVLCQGTNSLTTVKSNIKALFAESDKKNPGDDKIICTSAHRAKGLEKERVWVLNKTFKPKKSVAESNLMYVAVTRAKSHLFIVSDEEREAS